MEQYTVGHADLLTRVRNLQFRWALQKFIVYFSMKKKNTKKNLSPSPEKLN